jgi:DNA polymerase elongation subunit (family B)
MYTFVGQHDNRILYRGYEEGKRVCEDVSFSPSLFTRSNSASKWKTLDGQYAKEHQFDDIEDAKKFLYSCRDQQISVYGNTNYVYQFISECYPEEIHCDISKIKVCYIDIETECEQGFSKPADATEKISVISCVVNDITYTFSLYNVNDELRKKYPNLKQYDGDEIQMMVDFLTWWIDQDLDVVTGWNVRFFDMPYIVNRMQYLLDGPGGDFWHGMTDKLSPFGIIETDEVLVMNKLQQVVKIVGIEILDYYELYQKYRLEPRESYKLDYIAKVELNESKIPYEGSIKDFYKSDWNKFVEYNIQDSILVRKLEKALKFLELGYALAYDAKVNFTDVFYQVRMWDTILYNHLKAKNIVLPPKLKHEGEHFEGAYVKDPIVGMHSWVVSFDVNSLYPMTISGMNICPTTKIDEHYLRNILYSK